MDGKKLTQEEINCIVGKLKNIKALAPNADIQSLINMVLEYDSKGTVAYPAIRKRVPEFTKSLELISKDLAKEVAEEIKVKCKGCVFHVEDCFMNLIFIIFKSAELKKQVEFKDLRPNYRGVF